MPALQLGTSFWEIGGRTNENISKLNTAIEYAMSLDALGIDSGRDYKNEDVIGDCLNNLLSTNACSRENIFITTKVGNGQQLLRNMKREIDISLQNLRLDYIDLWMLHWPYPDYWLDNWAQMIDILHMGKVRAIGIANMRERHIAKLKEQGLMMPHVTQIEFHPLRTVPAFQQICRENGVVIEAYSSNCNMIPLVKENKTLNDIAVKHQKTISQIIMRWDYQKSVIPIFRSFTPEHIKQNISIFDFCLTEEEVLLIDALNIDYKFHPESINCPGY